MRSLPFILLALTASCNLLEPGEPYDRQVLLNELNRREAIWKARDIHYYDFQYQRTCFCAPVVTQPLLIEVRADTISRVLDTLGVELAPQQYVKWPTVDSLFVWLRALVDDRDHNVQAQFDPSFDYPSLFWGDLPKIADDEVTHRASNFVVQPTPPAPPIVGDYRMGAPASKSKSVTWRRR